MRDNGCLQRAATQVEMSADASAALREQAAKQARRRDSGYSFFLAVDPPWSINMEAEVLNSLFKRRQHLNIIIIKRRTPQAANPLLIDIDE